jgi:hypothetical protein
MSPTATRKQHGYYPPHDYADEGDLNIEWERPGFDVPLDYMVEHRPGPRERLILEGKSEYVRRLERAMQTEIETIRSELEGLGNR